MGGVFEKGDVKSHGGDCLENHDGVEATEAEADHESPPEAGLQSSRAQTEKRKHWGIVRRP